MTKAVPKQEDPGLSAFRNSRIYAEGWNAARKTQDALANPYGDEPQKSRWLKGFTEGSA